MPIDPELLADIVCPACRGELLLREETRLVCLTCRRAYPIRDDIPILLVDEATLDDEAGRGPEPEE
jgi:uncharacterized protein YbaR (Trm112 family)